MAGKTIWSKSEIVYFFKTKVTLGTGAALFLGRICAVLRKIPVIYSELHTFHNLNTGSNEYFEIPNRILNILFSRIPGTRVYKFLPVSPRLTEKLKLTVNKYPIETLFNGIRIDDVKKIDDYKPSDRTISILDKIEAHPTIVQVGVLDRNKNQLFTLKCVKALKEYIPEIRCLFIGQGDLMTELVTWASSNGLTEHTIFAGHLNRLDCLYLMSKSDVLVLTSLSEALPIVLIEAQAFSIPVIAVDVGSVSDIIKNGTTGYLAKSGDYKTFQQSLLEVLKNKTLAKKLGENAKQQVLDKFTIERRVERLVSMIENDLYFVRRMDKNR